MKSDYSEKVSLQKAVMRMAVNVAHKDKAFCELKNKLACL